MVEGDSFDFTRAPFRVGDGADPGQVAQEIVACFGRVAVLPRRVTQCFDAALRAIGTARADALARAGATIASDIDSGVGDGAGNPYHNSRHYCEVILSALCLARLAALTEREQIELLVAALAHDFHHDGKTVQGMPFRLERIAVDATLPYLEACGVPATERARVAALILATEVSVGVPFARRCYRHFFRGDAKADRPAVEPRLAALADDARLALQAVLLTEADVLPSAGLTVECGMESQLHLSQEWGRPLGPADKLYFLEQIFGDFVAGRFFSPNLERMKEAMRAEAKAIK